MGVQPSFRFFARVAVWRLGVEQLIEALAVEHEQDAPRRAVGAPEAVVEPRALRAVEIDTAAQQLVLLVPGEPLPERGRDVVEGEAGQRRM